VRLVKIFRWFRRLVTLFGLFLVSVLVLAMTSVPWNWYGALAAPDRNAEGSPDYIVMMGGGGIPSESGLMRSWKTAEAARLFSNAVVIVAMPTEENESSPGAVEQELAMRGVEWSRMVREPKGRNTREQAKEVYQIIFSRGSVDQTIVGVVTSPEHMRRTWFAFKRAGFQHLIALPSWPEAISADLSYIESDLDAPTLGGLVGGNAMIKYRFWDNLGILIKCARETAAMMYYRLMGWV